MCAGRLPQLVSLRERGCNPDDYNVIIDDENGVSTFLLYTLTGKLAGFQQYRPGMEKNVAKARAQYGKDFDLRLLRYYTYVPEKEFAIFGFDRFDWRKGPIYVVEGIFDAIALHNIGVNAIAVFGNNPLFLYAFKGACGQRLVAVCDNDAAGFDLARYCDGYVVCPAGKDPAEMTAQELKEMLHVGQQ